MEQDKDHPKREGAYEYGKENCQVRDLGASQNVPSSNLHVC